MIRWVVTMCKVLCLQKDSFNKKAQTRVKQKFVSCWFPKTPKLSLCLDFLSLEPLRIDPSFDFLRNLTGTHQGLISYPTAKQFPRKLEKRSHIQSGWLRIHCRPSDQEATG